MSNKRTPKRPIIPPRLHHTAITTLRIDAMIDWYEKVAGLTPSITAITALGSPTMKRTTGSPSLSPPASSTQRQGAHNGATPYRLRVLHLRSMAG